MQTAPVLGVPLASVNGVTPVKTKAVRAVIPIVLCTLSAFHKHCSLDSTYKVNSYCRMAPEVGDLQQALRHVLLPESACESQNDSAPSG